MDVKRVLGIAAAIILILLGVLFAIASIIRSPTSRLSVSIILLICGFGIIYFFRKKDKTAVVEPVKISLPGKVDVQSLRCPNCSAQLDAGQMRMKGGVPIIECPYCGASLELTEEPTW